MFGNITDDEDTFLPSSSNLASLFGVSNAPAENTYSLTYTAPKQPTTKNEKPNPNRVQSTLIIFKEVHAFKLIDKNLVNLGRCGFAFIGNESIKSYQLLVYKQKNDIICSIKFGNEFQFTERDDNYATFHDDDKTNWTVHFSTETDLKEFSQAIKNHGGKILKTNELLPLTKNIATSTDMKSAGKSKDSKDEVFMNKIDGESDSSNSNAKASLLLRMAKMGQKLLPNSNLSDGTDSDTEKEKKSRRIKRGTSSVSDPAKPDSKTPLPVSLPAGASAYTYVNGQYVPIIQSQYMPPYHQTHENLTSPLMYSLPTQPSMEQLHMYFTENRTHNSEVRMNILRLTDKMEHVLNKIQTFETHQSEHNPELDALKKENEKLKVIVDKLQKQIERYKELEQKHTDLVDQHLPLLKSQEELEKIISAHVQTEMKYLAKITELETVINKQNDVLKDYEVNSKEKVNIDETIKKLLNSLYSDINSQIPDDEAMYGRDLKKTLAQKFVDNAYSIIAVVGDTTKREKSESD